MPEEELQQVSADSAQVAPPQESAQSPQAAPQSKQEQLEALQSELNQSITSLEQDFAKKCASLCENDPELEELFFADKEAFFKKILEYQNEVINQEITQKQQKIANLEGEIGFENQMQGLEAAMQSFQEANPNIDAKELLAFFASLPEEIQAEIEKLPPEQVFDTLLKLKNAQEGGATQEQESAGASDLPQQVSGAPAAVASNEQSLDLPTQRY